MLLGAPIVGCGTVSAGTVVGAGVAELSVTVAPAGSKGLGVFAAEDAAVGRWVGRYRGSLVTRDEAARRYGAVEPSYLFRLDDDLFIDAQDSEHFSRFINHAEDANLRLSVCVEECHVDFLAARPIRTGDELCFDYGWQYWAAMDADPVSDTRSYGRQRWLRRQRKLASTTYPQVLQALLPVLIPLVLTSLFD